MPVSGSPSAVVAILSVVIESKGAAVEFYRMLSPALTGFHKALFEVSTCNSDGIGIAADKNPAPVPKRIPPVEVIGPGRFDVRCLHLPDQVAHLVLPIGCGAGLRGIRINGHREVGAGCGLQRVIVHLT